MCVCRHMQIQDLCVFGARGVAQVGKQMTLMTCHEEETWKQYKSVRKKKQKQRSKIQQQSINNSCSYKASQLISLLIYNSWIAKTSHTNSHVCVLVRPGLKCDIRILFTAVASSFSVRRSNSSRQFVFLFCGIARM